MLGFPLLTHVSKARPYLWQTQWRRAIAPQPLCQDQGWNLTSKSNRKKNFKGGKTEDNIILMSECMSQPQLSPPGLTRLSKTYKHSMHSWPCHISVCCTFVFSQNLKSSLAQPTVTSLALQHLSTCCWPEHILVQGVRVKPLHAGTTLQHQGYTFSSPKLLLGLP